jgi:hypothetical protein
MSDFWRRVHCAFTGHRRLITHLEMIDGTLWATEERCFCGKRAGPMFPGHLVKMQDQLTGITSYILGEDTH